MKYEGTKCWVDALMTGVCRNRGKKGSRIRSGTSMPKFDNVNGDHAGTFT